MKKLLIIALVLLLTACSNNAELTQTTETSNNEQELIVFTKESLSTYNGENGAKAYIAIEGLVYDVTDNPMWKNGLHQDSFKAGQDLTEQMKQAPHGLSKLDNLTQVGTYEE